MALSTLLPFNVADLRELTFELTDFILLLSNKRLHRARKYVRFTFVVIELKKKENVRHS